MPLFPFSSSCTKHISAMPLFPFFFSVGSITQNCHFSLFFLLCTLQNSEMPLFPFFLLCTKHNSAMPLFPYCFSVLNKTEKCHFSLIFLQWYVHLLSYLYRGGLLAALVDHPCTCGRVPLFPFFCV